MSITAIDVSPSKDAYLDSKGLIPHLVPTLSKLKSQLQTQLQRLEGTLAEQNHFIFQRTVGDRRDSVVSFLHVLQQYLDSTLKDLFCLIDHISEFLEDYRRDEEAFFDDLDSTRQGLNLCIDDVRSLVARHGQTIRDLSNTSSKINELLQEYWIDTNSPSEGYAKGCLFSPSMALAGAYSFVGHAIKSAVRASPETNVATDLRGTNQGADYSKNGPRMTNDTFDANPGVIQVADHDFQKLINFILKKMERTERFLAELQSTSSTPDSLEGPKTIRPGSYEAAQLEAKTILNICAQIQQYRLVVAGLKGQLSYRTKQVEERFIETESGTQPQPQRSEVGRIEN
ncbi:hypothetical protein BGZ83_004854 [Gryganskiella cystojenkinii]|nr:hypothetical protein BGZ83_004854 [Gryganskiella cystojenkinii]